jgi:hypothetical protein
VARVAGERLHVSLPCALAPKGRLRLRVRSSSFALVRVVRGKFLLKPKITANRREATGMKFSADGQYKETKEAEIKE